MRHPASIRRPTAWVLAVCLLAGCGEEPARESAPGPADEPSAGNEAFRMLEGRTFRRNVVFVASLEDSLLVVPWLVSARVHGGGVERSVQGLVLREPAWDPVYAATWEDPPTRAPWRLLPHDDLRVVVGMDDALESIVYDDGTRGLAVTLGEVLTEWSGPRGGSFRLLEGSVGLGGSAIDGLMLDMSRSSSEDEPRYGDWAFLVSGDSLQVVLHHPRRGAGVGSPGPTTSGDSAAGEVAGPPPEAEPPVDSGTARDPDVGRPPPSWQGWARLDFRELRWPAVRVEWSEVRAFERARRDVPVEWRISAPEEEIAGSLAAVGTHVEAGEGEGPQLPVSGLFGVRGVLTVEGSDYPVVGLLRHTQG